MSIEITLTVNGMAETHSVHPHRNLVSVFDGTRSSRCIPLN